MALPLPAIDRPMRPETELGIAVNRMLMALAARDRPRAAEQLERARGLAAALRPVAMSGDLSALIEAVLAESDAGTLRARLLAWTRAEQAVAAQPAAVHTFAALAARETHDKGAEHG